MKTILGVDIGYGHVKIVLMSDDGDVRSVFKYPSIIGITEKNEFLSDTRIYSFRDNNYYVGEDALNLPSENVVDITEYKNLEYYAPLFLYKALKMIDVKPDVIITGLSKAQLENSGFFKEALQHFTVNGEQFTFDNLYVLPQGAGSKLAIDKYGYDFPNIQTEFTGGSTYVGVDIGFNTLDMFYVSKGKASPNVFEGIEHEGVMKIAGMLIKQIEANHGRKISLHEAQDALDTKVYKLRGQKYDLSEQIGIIKKDYMKSLLILIENRYGKILDKCDFIFLTGGGSTFFNTTGNQFIRVPKSHHEYYNSVGFALWGIQKSKSIN